jgi:hypothetical protein
MKFEILLIFVLFSIVLTQMKQKVVISQQSVKLGPINEKCKHSHSEAVSKISAAGIGIYSSGNCSDRGNRRCTSLEQVKCRTIDGIVALKISSRCSIVITGRKHFQN